MINLNTLIPPDSGLTLTEAVNINDRGEIAGLGVPDGCKPADYLLCGHAYVLIPEGDCDDDCESKITDSQSTAVTTAQPSPVTGITIQNLELETRQSSRGAINGHRDTKSPFDIHSLELVQRHCITRGAG